MSKVEEAKEMAREKVAKTAQKAREKSSKKGRRSDGRSQKPTGAGPREFEVGKGEIKRKLRDSQDQSKGWDGECQAQITPD